MLEKLSFEIQESPVLYSINGEILTSNKNKVLSRSDNNKEISTMKVSYHPMLNEHFMESTERMQEISGFEFMGYSEISGGSVIISHLKNNSEDNKINGNSVKDYLILGSSFDGRYPFFIGTTTEFIRCQNQFSRISKLEKVRHTKSSPKKIEELLKTLEIYFLNKKRMYTNFEKMVSYEIDEATRRLATDYVMGITQQDRLENKVSSRKLNQLEMLELVMGTEMDELGKNLWGFFNGVTLYTTKILEQKEDIFGNIFGVKAELNNRAYAFSTNLIS